MAVRIKVDSIERDVSLIVDEMLAPEAQGRAIAAYAAEQIAAADALNYSILGRAPPRRTWVNGTEGASLENARPGGVIETEWELFGDILRWISTTLIERSPRRSGDYIAGHTLFADGVEVLRGSEIPVAEEYVFLNLVPYARKIEIGKTKSGRDFVIQVPNRIYERTATAAKARFGNMATIRFSYRAAEAGTILRYKPVRSRADRDTAKHERERRVPAIIVRMKGI
ncbi:hypothetical protein [Rhodopseudomonas sp.]|uniref:hypothetical protein n=1 Tax=Rhodopseudomonas sp. TaxID=1078 RepID=UPI003B3AD5EB